MTESTPVTWLTQEAHDRLSAELQQLTTIGRREIAEKIEAARSEGDLKENGGYHAAREEQAKQEARIQQLQQILRNAVVEPGMVVTATVAGDRMTFLIGSREVADGTDIEVFSERSPLGAAIIGCSAGDETSYEAPTGRRIPVTIHEAKPFQP